MQMSGWSACLDKKGSRTMNEMDKLEQMLKENNIPYEVAVNNYSGMKQIWYPNKEEAISDAICHNGSYGFKEGLLEIMGLTLNNDTVEGWLTAEEVCYRWAIHYRIVKNLKED